MRSLSLRILVLELSVAAGLALSISRVEELSQKRKAGSESEFVKKSGTEAELIERKAGEKKAVERKTVEKFSEKKVDIQGKSQVQTVEGLEKKASEGKTKKTAEGITKRYEEKVESKLGVMNKHGVTHYTSKRVRKAKSKKGSFWPDTARTNTDFIGAKDLVEEVSWGWHHPNGVFNTIPVGAPIIDADMNIFIGSDDAIRKFDIVGDLKWSYAPRGQLAAAPTLAIGSSSAPRIGETLADQKMMSEEITAEEEDSLRPSWAKNSPTDDDIQYEAFFKNIKIGDSIKVRPGYGYHGDGQEFYKGGDIGEIHKIIDDGDKPRAVILWKRTGHESVARLASLGKRFVRYEKKKSTTLPGMLVGSTTSGYVFAIDVESGEEVWATQASEQIHGMKGAVAAKDGVVVVATNRCTDRYCYRYRNQTNALWPSNAIVRGLSAADGSGIWYYKTRSPVWNMVPQWGPDDTVMFQDQEANAYSLKFKTGALVWMKKGQMGTTTNAAALYIPPYNILIALGPKHYTHKYCNPYPAPGILPFCSTWPGSKGLVRGLNASSGRQIWDLQTAEPPASAGWGMDWRRATKLLLGLGHNCHYNSPSQLWGVDPNDGVLRWTKDGPTLWSGMCAGDKEGGDIRRAMGGRATCTPNAYSQPVFDSEGDIYIGSQVGELQRWGTPAGHGGSRDIQVVSSLNTGVAFNDFSIAFAPGIMAVSTCTSLIVFQTGQTHFDKDKWTVDQDNYNDNNFDNESFHFPPDSLKRESSEKPTRI